MLRVLLPLLIVTVSLVGCDSDDLTEGRYLYTAFNEEAEIVATGSLQLQIENHGDQATDHVQGAWSFVEADAGPDPCHWIEDGRLEGEISTVNGEAHLDLNPGVVDNNMILSGRFEDDTFEGTWSVVTFAGVICSGRFEAVAS